MAYRLTVMLWLRGIIEDHYGVKPDEMSWVSTMANEGAGYVYPDGHGHLGCRRRRPASSSCSTARSTRCSRPTTLPGIANGDPRLRRLFPDPHAELAELLQEDEHSADHAYGRRRRSVAGARTVDRGQFAYRVS